MIGEEVQGGWTIIYEDIRIGSPLTQDVTWIYRIRYLERGSGPQREVMQQHLNSKSRWVTYSGYDVLEDPWITFTGQDIIRIKERQLELDAAQEQALVRFINDANDMLAGINPDARRPD